MSDTASNQRQYYVGVNGEQKGPYSDAVLIQMVQKGDLTNDVLVWYEGLSDWLPLKQIPELNAPKASAAPAPSITLNQTVNAETVFASQKSTMDNSGPNLSDHAFTKVELLEPVFDEGRANLSDSTFVKQRTLFIVLGVVGAITLGAIGFYSWAEYSNLSAKKNVVVPKRSAESARMMDFSKAMGGLASNPDASIPALRVLIQANPNDKIGKDSLEAVVEYYRRQQRPVDAGKTLMEAKRPAEAVKLFMEEPTAINETEAALGAAADAAQGNEKKEFLLKQIQILLGPIHNLTRAVERIKAFEISFPGEAHPYGYYLKTVDERIADLFSRISFHFTATLFSFLNTELPQINLVDHPLVEVKKSSTGEYRIIASYKGEVLLNQDRIPNIFIVFWLANDQWTLVDTNLTKERNEHGVQEREKHKAEVLSSVDMLHYLETIFRTQFPKSGLHETVSTQTKKVDTIVE